MFKEILATFAVLFVVVGYSSTRPFGDSTGAGYCSDYLRSVPCPISSDGKCQTYNFDTIDNNYCWTVDGATNAVPYYAPAGDCDNRLDNSGQPCPGGEANWYNGESGCGAFPCRIPV